ncbi:hypothetical protein CONPUDRAFT_140141 [Coniophora puteana RWD-64-598 SS2]|uniref:Uncharacterized protein n=1 Tax=Coniophora puteana (strain RWD-64-598) TaxID=741705 RepID=A0A5M3M8S0_CONPW|nr:uncharacterized protein CONPUDRAFT_140141 [Coniophora puteana RWD-64-598 SS2]EIW75175.1 hypothetical protein CONPUDRAFT_140141 [Coniophora puteana RWD-64-598 SS2]
MAQYPVGNQILAQGYNPAAHEDRRKHGMLGSESTKHVEHQSYDIHLCNYFDPPPVGQEETAKFRVRCVAVRMYATLVTVEECEVPPIYIGMDSDWAPNRAMLPFLDVDTVMMEGHPNDIIQRLNVPLGPKIPTVVHINGHVHEGYIVTWFYRTLLEHHVPGTDDHKFHYYKHHQTADNRPYYDANDTNYKTFDILSFGLQVQNFRQALWY